MNRRVIELIRCLRSVPMPDMTIREEHRAQVLAAMLRAFERTRRDENGRPRLSGRWR